MSHCDSVYQGAVTMEAGVLHVVILVQRDEKQIPWHSIYNEPEKAKAHWWFAGRICKNNKSFSLFILCGCVVFTQQAASDFSYLPRIVVNLVQKFWVFYVVCSATADV